MITFYISLEDAIDVLNKHIIDETLKNIILADEGVIIDSNICYETIYNILLFCFIHNTMFDEKQLNNIDNILKKNIKFMNTIKSNSNVQLIHATMPKSWTSLAQKIYYLFAEYGIESLKDCKADCNKTNYNIVKCYNMFCSAIAAYNVGKYKEANVIINYIKSQLKLLYPNMSFGNKSLYIGSGLDLSDVIKSEQKIEDINTLVGSYQIDVESDTYLYFVFSTGLSYNRITFNNYDIPFEELTIQEINGDSYQILKSVNTYLKGSYIIKIE